MRYHIITYGCQMNLYDSGLIETMLREAGGESVRSAADADIILVNTCSVRAHAEQRALGRITSLGKLKCQNPNMRIGVVGCMAKRLGMRLIEAAPVVDFVVGPDNYRRLPDLIKNGRQVVLNEENSEERYSECWSAHRRGPCAFIAIMRGCNNFCSYCVVPYLRGEERSRDLRDITHEAELLVKKGVKDVTLLGQNVNSYDDGMFDFPALLTELCTIPGIARVRFTTSHPKDVTSALLDTMASHPKLCNWLHLPVQSGSSRVLRRMNRGYSKEEYVDLVAKARRSIPDLSITTDIMVGFPGEGEDDFSQTVDLVEKVRFDFAYMFMYSKREGTRAAEYKDIPLQVRKRRLRHIIDVQNRITKERNGLLLGRVVEILSEGRCRKGNYDGYGKTKSNKAVLFKGASEIGEIVQVKVLGLSGWTPWGEVVND
jgi:tRNA-2-methylthio-N6-dimethylallyladenosine synthase